MPTPSLAERLLDAQVAWLIEQLTGPALPELIARDVRHLARHLARLEASERFHWLAAPSSTVIQPSPVHTGLSDDPEATLEHLYATLVA